MSWSLLLVFCLFALFYIAIPGIGAFVARSQWRGFRRSITDISRYPTASQALFSRAKRGFVGQYRFFGTLEAIQGEDRVWISSGRASMAVDLKNVRVYMLPAGDAEATIENPAGSTRETADDSANGRLQSVAWNNIFSLPEGTPILVGGALFAEDGRGVFRPHGRTPLLVVIHDCPREDIVSMAIRSGRQRNEYMNVFTLPSVIAGALILVLFAFSLIASQEQRIAMLSALTAGLAPASPFLPPGFPLYFAYRYFWKKGRRLRAQRDMVRLPLRYFTGPRDESAVKTTTLLPDGEPYLMIRGTMNGDGSQLKTRDGIDVSLPPETRRIWTDPPHTIAEGRECVAFGAYNEEGGSVTLRRPLDPMAQLVIAPSHPEMIAVGCEKRARLFEMVSVFCIVLGVSINIPLMFFLLFLLFK